jgi:T-complex protein 1 subunit zeta
MSGGLQAVNPNADLIGSRHAQFVNIGAAKSLQQIVQTNLGPRGTMKMLVGGAGQIKLTKDGMVLLNEMQIQHPTAAIIARTATAQDSITGDGTTSNVLFTGELLKNAERFLVEGLHPRVMVQGFELAREETLKFLEEYKHPYEGKITRNTLAEVARSSLRTKVHHELAEHLTEIVVDSVSTIQRDDGKGNLGLDLNMVEIMYMRHKTGMDTKFVNGLVLDHGARHPDMRKRSEKCAILILNVSLEYEKSEVNSEFKFSTPEERKALVAAERKFTDDKVKQVIELKRRVIDENPESKYTHFIVINMKGIDAISLDMLQREGIVGIRRAKRRNLERLRLSCGGYSVNSMEDIKDDCLGYAESVYEHVLGDDKYTFVEGCANAHSCTILINGQNDHTIAQIKDAIRDGLRAVALTLEHKALIPGAGAFELAAHLHLLEWKTTVTGRAKLGIQAFADALLVIPKTLAQNSGFDVQDTLIALLEAAERNPQVGLDIDSGEPCLPASSGIWDNYLVKKQLLHLGSLIAIKLLLVDEVMRAGRKMGPK